MAFVYQQWGRDDFIKVRASTDPSQDVWFSGEGTIQAYVKHQCTITPLAWDIIATEAIRLVKKFPLLYCSSVL
jgi:hypothetical protein